MRLQLRDHQHATLFNVYVPSLPEDRLDKEIMYPDLQLQ